MCRAGTEMLVDASRKPCSTEVALAASADSTAASTGPDTAQPSSVSPTPGAAPSSPHDSPAWQSTTTLEPSVIAIEAVGRKMSGGPEVGLGIREDGPMFTLDRESHHAVAIFQQNSPASPSMTTCIGLHLTQDPITEKDGTPALGSNSYVGVFLAKISPSPANAPGSRASDPPSSSSSPESQENLFGPEDTFWSRTSRVFSVRTADGTSLPSSGRWPNSGFAISRGEFSTPNSSEYPNVGGVCSSLRDVLEADVAPKYFLSQRAAAGILRRAQKRGKALPPHLQAALTQVATPPDDTKRTT